MRASIVELFEKSITLELQLNNESVIKKSIASTDSDFAYKSSSDNDVAQITYNGIIDLAMNDYEIDLTKLNELQQKALNKLIRFHVKDDEAKLKLGFYGEVLLNLFLQVHFKTDVAIARGKLFSPTSNSEIHGFDNHHFINNNNRIELWFGEVKFYENYSKALDKIWKDLENNLSTEYLSTNITEIIKYEPKIADNLMTEFLNSCKDNPSRILYDDLTKYNIKLVHPILIISNELKSGYTEHIKKCIEYINKLQKNKPITIPKDIDISLFFIFLTVNDAVAIKKEVLKWISQSKPLI